MELDKTLIALEQLRNGDVVFDWTNYNTAEFTKDWTSNRNVDWEKQLNGLLKRAEEVKADITKRLNHYSKQDFDPFLDDNNFDPVNMSKVDLPDEKVKLWKAYLPDLDKLMKSIKECQDFFSEKKDQPPYVPIALTQNKIPYIGNEQELISFFSLLIDSGFIGVVQGNYNNSIPSYIDEIDQSSRTAFKNKLIKKKELAMLIPEFFYVLDYIKTKNRLEEKPISTNTLRAKMSTDSLKNLDHERLDKLIHAFEKILKTIKDAKNKKVKDSYNVK